MLRVKWIQHAVGHGGFHTGHLEVPGEGTFNWAFDCGSRRTARFDEYLTAWARRSPMALDWLFVSHFDTDHVSGLDRIMSRTVVNNVMVPYLNEREFAYLLLHEIARDNLDRALFDLAADPAGFFGSRGADRVIFLRSGDADGGGGISEGGEPDRPKDERGWYIVITPSPSPVVAPQMVVGASISPVRTEIIEGGVCEIVLHARTVGLRLKPYRAPIQPYALSGIIKDIEQLVGTTLAGSPQPGLGALAYAVARHARTPAGRAGLRSIYKQYVGSSNRASLSLLSTPVVSADMNYHWRIHRPNWWSTSGSEAAWLNTGDAELLEPADFSDCPRPGARTAAPWLG
ncbi:metallo-beta-lactamase superfamily protein [Mesorhizobium loti]|uniref:Metallo-beta-lactamase superfamily protein n=1 Tax=Rhizobium loti TaxID=381 RepID=A0A8E3B3S9_RHILI|nr:MBL fold metallo-hydrolase [Mesorhizobium loti]PWJ89520.1 metallo-beta-lactamase superfamily protein [Mesorhizobium loti]